MRIHGVDLPDQKRAEVALTAIYGIGRSRSNHILKEIAIDRNVKIRDLTGGEEQRLRDYIENNFVVEGELRREVMQNVKRLKDVGAYRGARHEKRLPVRGQRTKTNSRTVRGNVRRTAGSGRKSAAEKT